MMLGVNLRALGASSRTVCTAFLGRPKAFYSKGEGGGRKYS